MEAIKNRSDENVGEVERWASLIGGGALLLYGLSRWSRASVPIALLGGELIYRGAMGYCPVYDALGISTSEQGEPYGRGVKVKNTIIINRPAGELYRFWKNFANLPQFMNHLESVSIIDGSRSRWTAKAPAGMTVEWDAEITVDRQNEMIGWRSLEGADVDNAGYVRFEKEPGGHGTVVRVALQYNPPAGKIGAAVAKLFGEEPELQIEEDLRRFKRLMEVGDTTVTQSRPNNRKEEIFEPVQDRQKPSRISGDVDNEENNVHEASEESFPASDSPAWTSRSRED